MKVIPLFTVMAMSLAAGLIPLYADTLYAENITITGTIQQPPLTSGDKSVILPITIPNVLSVLGITGVNAKNLRYYYYSKKGYYVIADKGIHDTTNATTLINLYAINPSTGVNWDVTKSKNISSGDQDGALNDSLSGTSFVTINNPAGLEIVQFIAQGSINSVTTVMSGKIIDKY